MSRVSSTFSGHPTAGILECRPGLKLGPYELVEMLGQGGMGAVWKATDTQGRRTVALKFLPSDFRGNKEAMAQVRSSFQVSHALTHQHLCKVLALVDDDPQYGPFLVMEFVPGITLSDYRRRFAGGRVPLPQVVSILSRVAEALDYAHQKVFQTPDGEHKGVLHRDVKPQNIMLCLTGEVIADVSLIDIGLAAEIRTTATRFTQARVDTRGTRPYMSPEQLSGKRSQWDGRTDQYSLGVVAYELLAGHPPFEADDDAVLMHAIVNVPPDPVNGLPGPVNLVLTRALSKKREQRFSCCLEFIRALHNAGTVKQPQGEHGARQTSGRKDEEVIEGLEVVEDAEVIELPGAIAVAELAEYHPAPGGTIFDNGRCLSLRNEAIAHMDEILARLPESVRDVSISGDQWSDANLEALRKLTHVEKLVLRHFEIGDEALTHIGKMKNLRVVNLYFTGKSPISAVGIRHLARLKELEQLKLPIGRGLGLRLGKDRELAAAIEELRQRLPLCVVS